MKVFNQIPPKCRARSFRTGRKRESVEIRQPLFKVDARDDEFKKSRLRLRTAH